MAEGVEADTRRMAARLALTAGVLALALAGLCTALIGVPFIIDSAHIGGRGNTYAAQTLAGGATVVLIAAAPAVLLGLLLLWAWRRIRHPSARWRPLAMAAGGLMMVAGLGAGLFTASMILRLIGAAFMGAAAVSSVALVSLVAGACAAVMTAGLFVGGLWLFRS